jgi:hypothetical protein
VENKGARNVHNMQLLSLGHTGGALKSTAVIDIPGVFLTKDGDMGMQAVQKECSYNKEHNFNLLSMSRLLHKQGWKITHGDESLSALRTEGVE